MTNQICYTSKRFILLLELVSKLFKDFQDLWKSLSKKFLTIFTDCGKEAWKRQGFLKGERFQLSGSSMLVENLIKILGSQKQHLNGSEKWTYSLSKVGNHSHSQCQTPYHQWLWKSLERGTITSKERKRHKLFVFPQWLQVVVKHCG